MADITEKNVVAADVDHLEDDKKVAAIKVLIGNESFNQAYLKEPPIPFNWIAVQLYMISIIGFCCSTSNGFDSSMFGNLLGNNTFLAFFNVGSVGIKAGIVSSMNQIGTYNLPLYLAIYWRKELSRLVSRAAFRAPFMVGS
jgi:hypothetical protein